MDFVAQIDSFEYDGMDDPPKHIDFVFSYDGMIYLFYCFDSLEAQIVQQFT